MTTFFRDTEAFEALALARSSRNVFTTSADDPIRVWVAGCATGEEAYSSRSCCWKKPHDGRCGRRSRSSAPTSTPRSRWRARARFPAAIEADVTEERLRRFFTREGDRYRVRQELRDIVLFAMHDLLKDPPFSRVDLISCRNLLIYLDRELQEQVCGTFHYALKPGGYLLLGASESADNPPGLFRTIDRGARIYQIDGTPPAQATPAAAPARTVAACASRPRRLPDAIAGPRSPCTEAALHRRALEKVAPPSILVDAIASRGAPVRQCRSLLPAVRRAAQRRRRRPGAARAALRAAQLAASRLRTAEVDPEPGDPGAVQRFAAPGVHVQVKPADDGETEPRQALVMFIEGEAVEDQRQSSVDRRLRRNGAPPDPRAGADAGAAADHARGIRCANEELRAANEELQSINEEYRSTSEELETSKEELQSINEELQTVNTELKLKLETISRAHSDLQNLMAATDFGTLFLDSSLRIKRFTARVTELFSVTPATRAGRSPTSRTSSTTTRLVKDARAVLADLAPIRREVRSHADGAGSMCACGPIAPSTTRSTASWSPSST